jgi:hypothetical protein
VWTANQQQQKRYKKPLFLLEAQLSVEQAPATNINKIPTNVCPLLDAPATKVVNIQTNL